MYQKTFKLEITNINIGNYNEEEKVATVTLKVVDPLAEDKNPAPINHLGSVTKSYVVPVDFNESIEDFVNTKLLEEEDIAPFV